EHLAAGQEHPWRIALDDSFVYWVGEGDGGALMRVAKGGGDPPKLATDHSPSSVATHRGGLYWATTTGRVLRTDPRVRRTEVLASTNAKPWRIAVDDEH